MNLMRIMHRCFWIVSAAAVVVLCAFFAAQAATHLVEARFLQDAQASATRGRVVVAAAEARPAHSKSGAQLQQRNMFCADCAPQLDSAQSVVSAAGLLLVATNVSAEPARSFATIVNTDSQGQGGYRVGDAVAHVGAVAVTVKEIHYRYVVLERGGQLERLSLSSDPSPAPVAAERGPVSIDPQDEVAAALDAGIKKVDEHHFELDRALVDKALANPTAFAKGLRAVPAVVDGKIIGFRLYAITAASAPGRLGLANGDTLQAINGFELSSIEKTLEVYTKLREASALELSILRRGKPVTLNVSIR
jgi:general secretion pathway protein C